MWESGYLTTTMNRRSLHWGAGFLVALVISGGVYWVIRDSVLATVTGVTWGSGVLMTLRIARQYPSHITGGSWSDQRWTGFSTGLVTLAGLIGVSPTLPISAELRLGLGLLVIGAGFAAYTAGTMAELERNAA